MATVQQCRLALRDLARKLARDPDAAVRIDLDRTIHCHIRDLHIDFHGRFRGGSIVGLADGPDPRAQIKISLSSDDLVALVNGRLHWPTAWASGRLSIRASFGDLLKLRQLL